MAHPDLGWMAMHVSEEGLFASVLHLDGSSDGKSQETTVHLKADVLSCTECTADASKSEKDVVLGEAETVCNLLPVFVQPLSRDDQLDASSGQGSSKSGFKSEERLILHPDFVGVLHDNLADDRLVSSNDSLVSEHVSIRMDRGVRTGDSFFWIGEGLHHLVVDDDRIQCPPGSLWVVSGHGCDWFAHVANDVASEDRLVLADQSVRRLAWYVLGGDDRVNAGNEESARDVD
jgi:hypothetical protein